MVMNQTTPAAYCFEHCLRLVSVASKELELMKAQYLICQVGANRLFVIRRQAAKLAASEPSPDNNK